MNAILYLCALPHQERATVKKLPATTRVRIRNPDRGKEIHAQQFRELLASMGSVFERACQISFT